MVQQRMARKPAVCGGDWQPQIFCTASIGGYKMTIFGILFVFVCGAVCGWYVAEKWHDDWED